MRILHLKSYMYNLNHFEWVSSVISVLWLKSDAVNVEQIPNMTQKKPTSSHQSGHT